MTKVVRKMQDSPTERDLTENNTYLRCYYQHFVHCIKPYADLTHTLRWPPIDAVLLKMIQFSKDAIANDYNNESLKAASRENVSRDIKRARVNSIN